MSTNPTHAPPPVIQPYASAPVTVILTVILLVFFFIGFFSIYFCRCFMQNLIYTWHLRHSPSGTPVGPAGGGGALGLDPSIISSFPTFVYSSVKEFRREKYGLECAICLCEFEDDNILRLLTKCCHVFHQDCIDLWLESHKSCPFCRCGLETPANSPGKSPVSLNSNSMRGIQENESLEDTSSVIIKDENDKDSNDDEEQSDKENHMAIEVDKNDGETCNTTTRFLKSKSTGHSIAKNVKGSEDEDRFTLRLPEHVRKKLTRGHTRSCTVFGEYKSKTSSSNVGFGEASARGDVNNV